MTSTFSVEMVPPDTNRGTVVAGEEITLVRKDVLPARYGIVVVQIGHASCASEYNG